MMKAAVIFKSTIRLGRLSLPKKEGLHSQKKEKTLTNYLQLSARAINESIAKRPDDLLVTMHICRGNFQSTYFSSGGYGDVSETIFGGLDVDGLFLEFDDDRSGNFEPVRHVNRPNLSVVLGLITSKFGELENPEKHKRENSGSYEVRSA